jgi:hypothetical protein
MKNQIIAVRPHTGDASAYIFDTRFSQGCA